MSRNRAMKEE